MQSKRRRGCTPLAWFANEGEAAPWAIGYVEIPLQSGDLTYCLELQTHTCDETPIVVCEIGGTRAECMCLTAANLRIRDTGIDIEVFVEGIVDKE
jgi:hypothetical protein